jgi:hypothetical protein
MRVELCGSVPCRLVPGVQRKRCFETRGPLRDRDDRVCMAARRMLAIVARWAQGRSSSRRSKRWAWERGRAEGASPKNPEDAHFKMMSASGVVHRKCVQPIKPLMRSGGEWCCPPMMARWPGRSEHQGRAAEDAPTRAATPSTNVEPGIIAKVSATRDPASSTQDWPFRHRPEGTNPQS